MPLAVLLAVLVCAVGLAGPATAVGGRPARASFGIAPSGPHGLDGRAYLNYQATPRSRLTDYVYVVNIGAIPLTLSIFATGAKDTGQATFTFLPEGGQATGVGAWISVHIPGGGSALHLAPRASEVVPISVAIPANAAPGDYAGGVVASLTSLAKDARGDRVRLRQQVAVRVTLRVAGVLHPGLSIIHVHAHYHGRLAPWGDGYVSLSWIVRNTGDVDLAGRVSASVTGLFGSRESAHGLGQVPVLLPGGEVTQSTRITGVFPEFVMHASVRVVPLIVRGSVDPGVKASYRGSGSFWAIPWTLLALIAFAVALPSAVRAYRRRARRLAAGAPTSALPQGSG
jgi:hypothetical protein